jgi:FAIM1 (Fas apoptotic inhibitory molecule) protein
MAEIWWHIRGKSGEHSVLLEHAYVSGQVTITVDGEAVYHRPWKVVDFGLKQTFSIDGLDCLVRITPMPWFTFWYRLYVNGQRHDTAA